jgi:Flp pilus assembly pilin Flp
LPAERVGTGLALSHLIITRIRAAGTRSERNETMNNIETSTIESRTVRAVRKLAKDTRGASFAEYIILVGLVAIAGMTAFQSFGDSVKTKVDGAKGKIESIPM